MQASIYEKYGNSEVLQIKEVPKPVPKENELLIKVKAATINRTDCAMLTAKPWIMRLMTGLFRPKNPVLGTDFAGVVEAIGKNVNTIKVGDRVFGFNDDGLSSHREYMVYAAQKTMLMPENVNFETAAASIEGMHYAYNTINKVALKKGQKVLVNGAGGAIGSAAVQLLKHFGAVVTAVAHTNQLALIESLGAVKVIDYTQEDFTKIADTFDYVFDTVGKSSFLKCKPLLNPKGVYISSELGWMAQNLFYTLFTPLFGGKYVKFPVPFKIKESLELVKKLMIADEFKPVIDRTYPLTQIDKAFEYVLTGQKTGNVVIKMNA